jgi:Cyclic nucleotide-binding domain
MRASALDLHRSRMYQACHGNLMWLQGADHVTTDSCARPSSSGFPSSYARTDCPHPSYGNIRLIQAGEVLFEPGNLGMPCFVVLSGRLDIAVPRLSGEQLVVTFGPGQFSGELVMISGARALSRGRAAETGEFLELNAGALRTLIAKDAELSDIFMRAFLLRRVAIISEGLVT